MSRSLRLLLVLTALLLVPGSLGTVMAQGGSIPRGGTVVINESPDGNWTARNFNPFTAQPLDPTRSLIYEPLIDFNPVDGGAPTWVLATAAEYSEDLMQLTFTLREGVRWSDGEEFNADDLVFTVELIQQFPALDLNGILPLFTSVEKVDDYTVTFNLTEVYTQADTVLGATRVVPEHIWRDVEDPVAFLNENPVATGPMTEVREYNESVFVVCRNPYYWQMGEDGQPLPYVDCASYPAYSGNDSVNAALVSGEVDWTGNFIPDINETFVARDPEHFGYYFWPEGSPPNFLYFNTTKAPFDSVNFRYAVSMAVDWEMLLDVVYGPGYSAPVNATGLNPGRYGNWMNPEALARAEELGLGQYNPARAEELLDEAGFVRNAEGIRTLPDGTPIRFSIINPNGWTDWTNSVQFVAQSLQEIGLDARLETPEFGTWFSSIQNADYDMAMGWAVYGRTPWDFYRNMLSSDLIIEGPSGLVANGTTWSRWTSEETDRLLADFTRTADLQEQIEIVRQLQMVFVENLPALAMFANPQWYEWNTQRFVGFPTPDNWYTQGSPWNASGAWHVINTIHCVAEGACD
jgi:peptide/nickel transport system substrate-binding protein